VRWSEGKEDREFFWRGGGRDKSLGLFPGRETHTHTHKDRDVEIVRDRERERLEDDTGRGRETGVQGLDRCLMAHQPPALHVFKRRRQHEPVALASRPSPSSAMSLVKALLGLTRMIAVCEKPQVLQRRNASNIARRIEMLASLFEEIRDLRRPLPPSVLLSFQELYSILSRAKLLLDDCREASYFCLLMEQESVAQQFQDLTQSMAVILQALPLELLDLQVEVKEQIHLVLAQVRKAKLYLDPGEIQLREEAKALLAKVENKKPLEILHLRKLFTRLQLLNIRDCETEMQRLEELRSEQYRSTQVVEKLTSFSCFVRYGKCVLYGIAEAAKLDVAADDAAARLQNSATTSSRNSSANEEVSTSGSDAADPAAAIAINPPEDFLCPINLEIMRDPVIVATGQTYERVAIARWLEGGHDTCPKSGQKLPHLRLIPNYALKNLITQWCLENNVPSFEKSDKKSPRRNEESLATNTVALEATKLTASFLTEMLLPSKSPETQNQAAYELRLLAKCGMDNRVCIANAGAIPLLVPLLLSKDPKTQENAVTALLNLSICESIKIPIMEARACEAIIEVLKSGGTMQARENAAATLFSLATVDDLKIVIGSKPDAIPALVKLLREGTSTRGKRDAATALYNLAVYQGNRASLVDTGAVPVLVSLLSDEEAAMPDDALALLTLIAGTPEGMTAIFQIPGVIPILVRFLSHGSSRGKEHAIVVLLALCRTGGEPIVKSLLKDSNAFPSIYHLFTTGSTPRAKQKAGSLLKLLLNWKSAAIKAAAATAAAH
jgi:hypothetical protein